MRKRGDRSGREPILGGDRAAGLSGLEPALGSQFGPLYGQFRVEGLEAPPVPGRRRPLVMLADVDESTGELIGLLARSNGYDVRCIEAGDGALAVVRALGPNLIVVGLNLQSPDGLDLIRRLRSDADRSVSGTAVIAMDTQYGIYPILRTFECGADDYLEMPYEAPALLRTWRRAVGHLRRPAPVTALLNGDDLIRRCAITHLLSTRPDGLEEALAELLWQPDPAVRGLVRWALQRLGTEQARIALQREADSPWQEQDAPPGG